ncbi:MAG: aminopeptidase P family protein [Gemmatimonadaceae bacterium]
MPRRPTAALASALLALTTAALGAPAPRPLGAQVAQSEYAARRAALAAALEDGVVLALGAPEPAENYLSFNQGSRFLYLTGVREPDAALVMVKRGGAVTSTLFVLPRDPAREVWTGSRLGAEAAAKLTGIPARDAAELPRVVDSLLGAGLPLRVVANLSEGGEQPAAEEKAVAALARGHEGGGRQVDLAPTRAVDRLRGTKSAAELDLIRKAVAITVDAQRAAMSAVRPGINEFELQALIEYTFRRNGADRPSFATIVGSGPNATTLHYNADDRFTQPGDMVVMDIGASYRGYAADVTRSVPVSGKFTPEQRAVYQLVRDAQSAAERRATVGTSKRALAETAAGVIAAGLARLGLIESPDATYDCGQGEGGTCPQYRLYYMHGLGHGIGLDVHDPDQYDWSKLAPGSAFTIEPGVYVRGNLLEILPDTPRNRAMIAKIRPAVERYRNVGVRIEDDYIATDSGVEWVSRAPRELAEVEALLARPRTDGVTKRDEAKVEWYRATAGNR